MSDNNQHQSEIVQTFIRVRCSGALRFSTQPHFTAEKDTTGPQWVDSFSLCALIKFKVGSGGVSGVCEQSPRDLRQTWGSIIFQLNPLMSPSVRCVRLYLKQASNLGPSVPADQLAFASNPSLIRELPTAAAFTHTPAAPLVVWAAHFRCTKRKASLAPWEGTSGSLPVSLSHRCYAQGELVRADKSERHSWVSLSLRTTAGRGDIKRNQSLWKLDQSEANNISAPLLLLQTVHHCGGPAQTFTHLPAMTNRKYLRRSRRRTISGMLPFGNRTFVGWKRVFFVVVEIMNWFATGGTQRYLCSGWL